MDWIAGFLPHSLHWLHWYYNRKELKGFWYLAESLEKPVWFTISNVQAKRAVTYVLQPVLTYRSAERLAHGGEVRQHTAVSVDIPSPLYFFCPVPLFLLWGTPAFLLHVLHPLLQYKIRTRSGKSFPAQFWRVNSLYSKRVTRTRYSN